MSQIILPAPTSRQSLQFKVAVAIHRASRRAKAKFAEAYRDDGHTGAPIILLYQLINAPKGLTHRELGERVEIAGPTLSKMIDRLEADGLVTRRRMFGDGRARLIVMEPAGRPVIEKFERLASAMRDDVFSEVSDEDLAVALRVLSLVGDKLLNVAPLAVA